MNRKPMNKFGLILLLVVFCGFAGCRDNRLADGEGRLSFAMRVDSKTHDIYVTDNMTKSVVDMEDYTMTIRNADGKLVRDFAHKADIPEEIWLIAGEYTIRVIGGKNEEIALNSPYYVGEQKITITPDQLQPVEVVCRLANAKVSANYSDRIKKNFKAYKTRVFNSKGDLTLSENTTDAVFVKATGSEQVTWEVSVTNMEDKTYTQRGKITELTPCDHYMLNFDINDDYQDGGLLVDIVIDSDAKEIDTGIDIPLKKLPEIKGVGFDIAEPFAVIKGLTPSLTVDISGTPKLESVYFSHNCKLLTDNNIPESVELIRLQNKTALRDVGITWNDDVTDNLRLDMAQLAVNLAAGSYSPTGEYSFTFTVRDTYGKQRETTLKMVVSGADVMTLKTSQKLTDIWATKAVLYGRWVTADQPAGLAFEMRKKGESDSQWQTITQNIQTDASTQTYKVALTGLTPNTAYEYRAKLTTGGDPSNVIESFTTEMASPLPNGSFDDWYQSGKVWYPDKSGDPQFWDTGNTGTTTLGDSNTSPTNDTHSGNGQAAYLYSKFVGIGIGQFAAGNIYSGRFIDTDGMNGILSFGREYTSRPTKLEGYYKYTSVKIDKRYSSSNPNLSSMKGKPDTCIVYVALTDWDGPLEIRTNPSNRRLFDPTDSRVIAYGEFSSGNSIGEYTKFTVQLKYRSTTRQPKYIVVVGSASKYGDYFTGGEGSTLWLDELELKFD